MAKEGVESWRRRKQKEHLFYVELVEALITSGSNHVDEVAERIMDSLKDKKYSIWYFSVMSGKEIESIGPEKVVQVVTDNAANCKLADSIIEKKYPWIFW
ncbi:hypothetical protein RJ640_000229 [Escallonia rubra]|uniref:DUF659 domain-containing protein n=1 Tax=Escallonia rubra TaxID=112253 RepID=A0AA88UIS6_9ASTE|nr:hypothetical protein RJ640_000229 [Escallonia rubra]